jgi:hypothetical protein
VPFFFTKLCLDKRSEKSGAKEMSLAIFVVENSISNVAYNRPVVAAATKYVAENILDVFLRFSDFREQKSDGKFRHLCCIPRKTARNFTCIL